MTKSYKVAIWGTGSLCSRFLEEQGDSLQYDVFVDANGPGEFLGMPVLPPEALKENDFEKMVICSTYFNEIIPQCLENGLTDKSVFIVLPVSLEKISLSAFTRISDKEYHYLPWTQMMPELKAVLSNDIMFPDNYKDIARSIAYAFLSSVEGDFAEFGTCSGFSATMMANTIEFYSKKLSRHELQHNMAERKLCLFDSFEGFPEATQNADLNSPHVASGAWGKGTAKGLTAEQLKRLCSQFIPEDRLEIYEGWYKNTLTEIPNSKRFCCVHMDCDLYESTLDVLTCLFSQKFLSEGAILLFDNWYSNRASDAYGEQRAWDEINQIYNIRYTNLGMYGCVGNRIIIHDYYKKSS